MTVITYSNKTVLPLAEFLKGNDSTYYTYQLDGADFNSATLVFKLLPTPLVVLVGQQFQLWYAHDLVNYTEDNNDGKTCQTFMLCTIYTVKRLRQLQMTSVVRLHFAESQPANNRRAGGI